MRPFVPSKEEGMAYDVGPSSADAVPSWFHPPTMPTPPKGYVPYLFIQTQLWRGTTGILTG